MTARRAIATVFLSAAGLVGILSSEGYEPVARPPVPGDVPTNGFGSTGADIKAGDKTDPVSALIRAHRNVVQFEGAVKRCVRVPLHQHEYDAYLSLAYNIGPSAFCNSTLVRKVNAEDYAGGCAEVLRWDKFQGKPLLGLTKRREREFAQCMGQSS